VMILSSGAVMISRVGLLALPAGATASAMRVIERSRSPRRMRHSFLKGRTRRLGATAGGESPSGLRRLSSLRCGSATRRAAARRASERKETSPQETWLVPTTGAQGQHAEHAALNHPHSIADVGSCGRPSGGPAPDRRPHAQDGSRPQRSHEIRLSILATPLSIGHPARLHAAPAHSARLRPPLSRSTFLSTRWSLSSPAGRG
jgi:hypothetical protein